jgi:hypothetical protein
MRSLIASVVVLTITAMLATEVSGFVGARISALTDAVSLSSRSATK